MSFFLTKVSQARGASRFEGLNGRKTPAGRVGTKSKRKVTMSKRYDETYTKHSLRVIGVKSESRLGVFLRAKLMIQAALS